MVIKKQVDQNLCCSFKATCPEVYILGYLADTKAAMLANYAKCVVLIFVCVVTVCKGHSEKKTLIYSFSEKQTTSKEASSSYLVTVCVIHSAVI